MSLTSPQRRLLEDISSPKEDMKPSEASVFKKASWSAVQKGKTTELQGVSLTPDDLRKIADALELRKATGMSAIISWPKV